MRSCGSVVAAAALLVLVGSALHGQSNDAGTAYRDILARETPLRRDLDSSIDGGKTAGVLQRVRAMVAEYEALSRRFPTSGYSDNALWQGALLSADAFHHFGEPADRQTARRLLESLGGRFPSSSLVKNIPEQLSRLARTTSPAARNTPARPATSPAAAAATTRAAAAPATLTAIHREVLQDAVRITLTLEHETPFVSDELENPSRLFVDLQNTRTIYALKDARLTYADDVVRQVRVGRQDGDVIRVVLDLEGAGRFSIYPVYNPYRLVIDFERAVPKAPPSLVATREAKAPVKNARSGAPPKSDTAGTRGSSAAPTADPASREPALKTGASKAPPIVPSANGRGGFSLSRQLGLGIARIVIDPGHGGHDPGAKTNGATEAELVLDVALKLEQLLLKQPGVEVILTRRDSTFIPLEERTAIANREQADLFLSIHANASTNRNARGIETYFLNFAPNAEAESIAARENAGSSRTMGNLPEIVRAIALNNKIDESRDFARLVQQALYDRLRKANKQARNLGVKQAPFQVLIGATMPSILAEISFITNRQEGGLLKTEKYRSQIAEALLNGVMTYQRSLKRVSEVAAQ